jgi:uncharacterized protein with HEPN domain
MKQRDELLLTDVIAAAEKIAAYLAQQTRETFFADDMRRDAVLMQLLVIGEAASRVQQPLRDRHPQVEWAAIAGFRNRAIHAYRSVDWEIVWNAATVNVPALIEQITAILAEEFPTVEEEQSGPEG